MNEILLALVALLAAGGVKSPWPKVIPPIPPVPPVPPFPPPPHIGPGANAAPPVQQIPPTGTPPALTTRLYTIKKNDYPSGLAARATGNGARWKEILPLNPTLQVVQGHTPQGAPATYVQPWDPGQVIAVPTDWKV